MPRTTRTTPENPALRQRRRVLKKMTPSSEHCAVPGCEGYRLDEDCCYTHSVEAPARTGVFLPNDGIIDWQAIDIARRGLRVVGLTWVEFEIAVAYMLIDGLSQDGAAERAGVAFSSGSARMAKIRRIADALGSATGDRSGTDAPAPDHVRPDQGMAGYGRQ